MSIGAIVLGVIIIIVALLLLRVSIRIVPQNRDLVVQWLGRYQGTRDAGLRFLIPIIQQGTIVDMRERVKEIPQQTCITKDNAPINIDFLIFSRVLDARASVFEVQNFDVAVQGIATTTLRAVIGDIALDDVLAKREQINEVLRAKLDEVTQRWGVKVTTVEIREIIPPREIQEAMNRQMSAERNRRAAILEAEGKKQSAILVAEGSKQAAILEAEGQRQAQILKAEGFALALTKVYESAQTVDAKTMTLQYLEALRALGAGPATKFIIPTEFTALAAPLLGFTRDSGAASERK
jgi:regulator of protease activity HflC (stomatin/prohibitin superfamily)